MLWFKALHLIFMVTWFAGLFYLPRLFVYHSMSDDPISLARFKLMERKLYYGITTPGAVLTLIFGLCLFYSHGGLATYSGQSWLTVKFFLIVLLLVYHVYCGVLLRDFKHDQNKHSAIWYRWFNEIPVIILIAIMILAVVRPF